MVKPTLYRPIFSLLALLAVPLPVRADGILEQLQKEVSAIATKTKSAVVTIEDEGGKLRVGAAPNPPERFALEKAQALGQAYRFHVLSQSGSGFSIGDGYVVTTADVLNGMKNPLVITDNGTRIKAQTMGINNDLNVGLLKLLAKVDLPALKLGDSAGVAVGHFAISVGNQGGQANSVALMLVGGIRTDGVSAGNHYYPNLIQIAGTVGAGISGAPLVDAKGEVIGIMAGVPAAQRIAQAQGNWNSFFDPNSGDLAPDDNLKLYYRMWDDKDNPPAFLPKPPYGDLVKPAPQAKPDDKNAVPLLGELPIIGNLFQKPVVVSGPDVVYTVASVTSAGFAVPINDLKPVLEELKTGKPVVRGWIGIAPKDEITRVEKDGIVTINHLVSVAGVYPDSPAFRAGAEPGDVILRINNKPIGSAAEVREVSQRLRPGDALTLHIRRSGKEQTLNLHIEARPETIKPPITAPNK